MKWFRLAAVLIVLLLNGQVLYGQFGVRAYYGTGLLSDFDNILNANSIRLVEAPSDINIGMDYWLRLKNHRIEFYPTIEYGNHQISIFDSHFESVTMRERSLSLVLNTQVYPFDLLGDCDCPTFSKQSGFLKKGFFILGGASMNYHIHDFIFDNSTNSSGINANFLLGAGIDIGASNLITISPQVRYKVYPNHQWKQELLIDLVNIETRSQFQFGIRIGFRPDYK